MCQRGSKARYGVRNTRFVEADHVRIPFDHHKVGKLPAFLQVQAVEVISLVIEQRIAGVDIFRLVFVVEHACAETDHAAVRGNDREDHPPAIGVVGASGIRVFHE
ncbi:hypothetical protein SDC9_166302 [bioreactor metagenome]|uniref:Uncharacterized protein n=1 Tax=bioreactor metagenome TaxID=1076179 RepID=A0A645FWR0_9ZZZZ